MPIHLDDLDPVSEAEGLDSVVIVPCNLCPAVTVAVAAWARIGGMASGSRASCHALRPPLDVWSRRPRSCSSARRVRVRTVSTGMFRRFATSRGGSSSK